MNKSQPVVTIVTPSYNQAEFLEQTMQSVFNQTYPRIEYIVTDAGSKDASVEIIRKYEHRLRYWHSHKDKGSADGIHQGLQQSTGQIMAWLNSDDALSEDAVERAVGALQRHPEAVMVYGNRVVIDEKSRLLYYRASLPFLSRTPFISAILPQETCFFRRETYYASGGLDANMWFSFDYDLFSKFAQQGPLIYSMDIWGFFRKHSASRTMLQRSTVGEADDVIVQKRVWGGCRSQLQWRLVRLLVRTYAIGGARFTRKPSWPRCFPSMEKVGLLESYFASLHETSRWKRLLGTFLSKRKP